MATYTFQVDIDPGDLGQTTWANQVGQTLNTEVGNIPVVLSATTPTYAKFVWFKDLGNGLSEIWIEDGT